MQIILNSDGSIYKLVLPKYVNQGSDGPTSTTLFIGFKDATLEQEQYTVIARFKLPNGETNQLVMSRSYYPVPIQGVTYPYGWVTRLTAAQTLYAGILYVSFEIIDDHLNILYSIPAKITVNPTTYQPDDEDVNINNAEYENIALELSYLRNNTATQNYVLTKITEAQLQPGITLDTTVTSSSSNGVTSGAVFTFVSNIIDNFRGQLTNGTLVVAKATNADNATNAQKALLSSFSINDDYEQNEDEFNRSVIPDGSIDPENYLSEWKVYGTNHSDRGPYVGASADDPNKMKSGHKYLVKIKYRDNQGSTCFISCGVIDMTKFPTDQDNYLIETPMFKIRGVAYYIKAQFTPDYTGDSNGGVRCSVWEGRFSDYTEQRGNYSGASNYFFPELYYREIK